MAITEKLWHMGPLLLIWINFVTNSVTFCVRVCEWWSGPCMYMYDGCLIANFVVICACGLSTVPHVMAHVTACFFTTRALFSHDTNITVVFILFGTCNGFS